ncbi:tRNA (adenosine(37)-N6)-threonylcarbamoyltransferase complex ATPase subunit type 1 TsaE [Magnetospira thiophila]
MNENPEILTLDLDDEAATCRLAARLAGRVRPGDIIALSGTLGSGKSVFARAFIQARGCREEVPSPTFTLVQVYDLPGGPVHHFDLYRLEHPQDAWELDLEDAFAEGISLIEWPENLGDLLPQTHLGLRLDLGTRPEQRKAQLSGPESWCQRLRDL